MTQQDKDEMYQYLLSKGISVTMLPDGTSDLSNKYLGPVIEYAAGGTSGRLVRLAVSTLKGDPGKDVSMQRSGDYVQWKSGDAPWANLIALSDLQGDNISLRKGATGIEWKCSSQPDTAYQVLVNLSAITGDSIVLRKGSTAIEWKKSSETDTAYRTLVNLSDLKGQKGDGGKNFAIEV